MAFKSISTFVMLATMIASASLSSAIPITLLDFESEAFDLDARAGALSCYPVDVKQIKALPAWKKIEKYAEDNWGKGGVNIVTNPDDYPDRALQACMKSSKINTQFKEKPQCTTDRRNIEGQSLGTKSDIEFTTKRGTSQSSSWTVTRGTTVTAGVKYSVTVGIPKIGDATAETSLSTEVKNERSSSFTGSVNNEQSITMKFSNEAGKKCKVELVTQTCSATASGRVPVVLDGFVWFNYKSKRASKKNPKEKHYKYSANINKILSEAERTSYIEFQGPVNSKSSSTYKTNCAPIGKGAKAVAVKKKPTTEKKATPAKKPAAKAPAKKKSAPAKKAPAKKAPAKKAPAKKAPAKPKKAAPKPAPAKKPKAKTPSKKQTPKKTTSKPAAKPKDKNTKKR